MNVVQLQRLHAMMREAIREYVRACQKEPMNLTMEQHKAMQRGSDLLRGIDKIEAGRPRENA